MKLKLSTMAAALAAALLLSSCAQTTSSGAMTGQRSQLMLVSSETLNAQAAEAYDEVIAEAKNEGALNNNSSQVSRVKKVANRLISAAPYFREDCQDWDWEVNVITSDTVNAWCMPGGKIAVYTGLIDSLDLTDDELAVVVGHEMAHALREHSREQASQNTIKQGALFVAQLFGANSAAVSLGSTLADLGLMLPFSREHETEADEVGLELCYRAGFDVDAGPEIWRKMEELGGGEVPEILSTHPSSSSRIANLEKMASDLKTFHAIQD